MTKHDLKELAAIGAELGAAKAENDRLRGLLREACELIQEQDARIEVDMLPAGRALMSRIDAALSQQAEPTDTYTAVDMATAAAQWFRDGQAAVEQAAAQDERKTFEVEIPDISAIYDGRSFIPYRSLEAGERLMTVAQHLRIEKQLRAALARPAQAEQQPKEEIPKPDGWVAAGRFFTDRDEAIAAAEKTPCVDVYFRPSLLTVLARSAERQSVAEELARLLSQSNRDIRQLYAAPIAQTEQQPVAWVDVKDRHEGPYEFHGIELLDSGKHNLYAAPIAQTAPQGKFRMGDLVKKSTGSEWVGRVVGWYSTEQTKEGYAVESSAHRNSVQIYPAKALEAVE